MATYWENSCSFGLRYVSWYKYLIVSLVFSHLGFWSGNLFLIAPFPDLCLLVPFFSHWFSEWEFLIAPFVLIIIIAYIFPFRCHFREVTFTARLEFRKYKYSRPLTSIDYLKQIHIPFTAVSGSHFYGKPIYCLFKKADKGGFQKSNKVFFNIKAERISFIHIRSH